MKTIALLSGGKDSVLSVMVAMRYGHTPVVIANMTPAASNEAVTASTTADADGGVNEVDSYMFQTVGHEVVEHIAHCMELPLRRSHVCRGQAKEQSLSYTEKPPEDDEVEQMYRLLKAVKEEFPEAAAVTTGAILSNYQRNRVEIVCARLGLVSLAYLWQRPAAEVLDMVTALRMRAILVKTASVGLEPRKLLGKTLEEARPVLQKMESLYGSHMAGEGGEFETIVLDCPLYRKEALEVKSLKVVMVDENDYSPSGHCTLEVARVPKTSEAMASDAAVLQRLLDTTTKDGFCFPSDDMAAMLNLNMSLPLSLVETESTASPVEGDVRHENASEGAAVAAILSGGGAVPLVVVESNSFTSGTSGEAALQAAAAWATEREPIACFVECPIGVSQADVLSAFAAVNPLLNPPCLSATWRQGNTSEEAAAHTVTVSAVACCPQAILGTKEDGGRVVAVQRQMLHAQSLSCWAAGSPFATYSQAAHLTAGGGGRVTMAVGVQGRDPTTGLVATKPIVSTTHTDNEMREVHLLATQLVYAYASAAAFLAFYGASVSEKAAETSVVVTVQDERFVPLLPGLWLWCANGLAHTALKRFEIVIATSLVDGALVQLTIVQEAPVDEGEDDDSDE